MTLCRYRMRPSTPPSLVKFAVRLASVSTGRSSSTPTSDHVPQEMYAKSGYVAGTPTTADAVSCEATAVTAACAPDPAEPQRDQRSDPRPQLDQRANSRAAIPAER